MNRLHGRRSIELGGAGFPGSHTHVRLLGEGVTEGVTVDNHCGAGQAPSAATSRSDMAIRILLIETHRLFREAFSALLRTQPDFELVDEGGSFAAALSIAERAAPDVALIDSALVAQPDSSMLRDLSRLPSPPRMLAIETTANRQLLRGLGNGLGGIVCRDDSSDEAFTAIRTVAAGRTLTPRALHAAHAEVHNGDRRETLLHALTAREQEVLDFVLRGWITAQIARQLALSPRTVETHRARLMRKLGVHSTVDLVRMAAHNGILPS
jgi:DNA-binding NarL/FixJ family response regulator